MMPETLTRTIRFYPGYDKRHPDPMKNYGIGSAEFGFYLTGAKGTIQFTVCTGWHLPGIVDSKVLPVDLGYHARKPQYDGQEPIDAKCQWTGGNPCYYDGSSLAAEDVFNTLVREGDEAVWAILEKRYHDQFGNQ